MKKNIKVWIQAIRAYSFTASVVPVLICFAIAIMNGNKVGLLDFFLMLLGVLCIHAATNLVNDFYDYIKGVDRKETKGSSMVLVDGLLKPAQLIPVIAIFYSIALIIGTYFIYTASSQLLWFILIGLGGSYFYTAGNKSLKYLALGEPAVFLLMGPFLFLAIYFGFTAEFSLDVLLFSLPVGLQIMAIITANNIRDIDDDKASGIKTIAMLLGKKKAKYLYYAELDFSYLLLGIYTFFYYKNYWLLLPMISLPIAFKLVRTFLKEETLPENIVENTARFQMIFGLLLFAALMLTYLLG